ncbi:interleukin-6-like, partial [Nothobranchius furzeri]
SDLCLLAAAMLVTALCASAAPLAHTLTVSPPGEETGVVLSSWELALEALKHHQEEFEEEFQGNIEYTSLDKYNRSSFPVNSPNSSFSKWFLICVVSVQEAFLQRLTQGMHIYMVLLRHVEKEYPHWSFLTKVKNSLLRLITLIKGKVRTLKIASVEQMLSFWTCGDIRSSPIGTHSVPNLVSVLQMRNSHRVTVPTSSQVSQMLSDLSNTDDFHRKMRGHSVLYHLRNFLVDGKRAFKKWDMTKQCANRTQNS